MHSFFLLNWCWRIIFDLFLVNVVIWLSVYIVNQPICSATGSDGQQGTAGWGAAYWFDYSAFGVFVFLFALLCFIASYDGQ